MRRIYQILTGVLLLALLAGCGGREKAPEQPVPPAPPAAVEEAEWMQIEELEAEVIRGSQSAGELMAALRELPEQLQTALAAQDVQAERITMTAGASPEATAQAVAEGGVDLAFLPAETFAALELPPRLLLAGGAYQGFLCAGATEYGGNLAARSDLTWEELSRARWGVTDALLPTLDLYLADHYRGNTADDLKTIAVFADETALRQAAERGELDLFVTEAPRGEDTLLAETEQLYKVVAVASAEAPRLTKFTQALAAALAELDSELLGGGDYEAVENAALNPMRRLLTIQSE